MFDVYAVAAEGDSGMISTALENVTSIFSSAVNMVTGNPIAMVFIGISLAGAGIALFRKVRRG